MTPHVQQTSAQLDLAAYAQQKSGSQHLGSARVLARVLKFRNYVLPSVFECLRVLSLAISAHEII
jgi:hypothetical protein